MHVAARRRHQLHTRVLGAHTAGARAVHGPHRLRHAVRRAAGGRKRGGRRAGRPVGPQAHADRFRGRHGRDHGHVRRLLLAAGRAPRRVRGARVAAVPVLRVVRGRLLRRRGLRSRRAPRRDVPRQRALALFRRGVHHAGRLLVRHQQGVPAGVPPVRVPRHVRPVHRGQRGRRRVLLPVRDRDQGQNVRRDPAAARGRRQRDNCTGRRSGQTPRRPTVIIHYCRYIINVAAAFHVSNNH